MSLNHTKRSKLTMNNQTCANCAAFVPHPQADAGVGYCHFNPPQLTFVLMPVPSQSPQSAIKGQMEARLQDITGWPAVKLDEWCLSYRTNLAKAN